MGEEDFKVVNLKFNQAERIIEISLQLLIISKIQNYQYLHFKVKSSESSSDLNTLILNSKG